MQLLKKKYLKHLTEIIQASNSGFLAFELEKLLNPI